MAIYKYVLHHRDNTIPKWFLETIGTYVSYLNKCDYCFEHHFVGLKRNLKDDPRADAIRNAIATEKKLKTHRSMLRNWRRLNMRAN